MAWRKRSAWPQCRAYSYEHPTHAVERTVAAFDVVERRAEIHAIRRLDLAPVRVERLSQRRVGGRMKVTVGVTVGMRHARIERFVGQAQYRSLRP
jgi:hypothetical protein